MTFSHSCIRADYLNLYMVITATMFSNKTEVINFLFLFHFFLHNFRERARLLIYYTSTKLHKNKHKQHQTVCTERSTSTQKEEIDREY